MVRTQISYRNRDSSSPYTFLTLLSSLYFQPSSNDMSFPLYAGISGAESQGEKGNGFLEPGMVLYTCNPSTWEEVENLESSLGYIVGMSQQDKMKQKNSLLPYCASQKWVKGI